MANEVRLIDADALLEDFGEEPLVWSDGEAEIQERNDWRKYKGMVESAPTVDAVEVVHGLGRLADYLIAHGVTILTEPKCDKVNVKLPKEIVVQSYGNKWISVEERLPEANTEVLTYRKGDINLEWRWHTYWDNDEFSDCPVTHWMLLPEPPKGE